MLAPVEPGYEEFIDRQTELVIALLDAADEVEDMLDDEGVGMKEREAVMEKLFQAARALVDHLRRGKATGVITDGIDDDY